VPQPRTRLAQALRAYAHAAMDISDGLAGDLAKLAAASGVSAAVEVAKLPLSSAAGKLLGHDPRLIEAVCTGGDDYEILAAVSRGSLEAFRKAGEESGVAIAEIGVAGTGAGVEIRSPAGEALRFKRPSFSHF
jgi:thiamine-monophosphate kinase